MTDQTDGNVPDTRQRILIEASRLLSLNGYRGTTTRDIASAVGISQPSLFFHFPTKIAIVEELYRYDVIPALRGFENLVAGRGSPAAKLFFTTDEGRRPSQPDESTSLVLRGLLADPETLDEVRAEATGLGAEYRAAP